MIIRKVEEITAEDVPNSSTQVPIDDCFSSRPEKMIKEFKAIRANPLEQKKTFTMLRKKLLRQITLLSTQMFLLQTS